jgi:hypothetical protein
VDHSAAFCAQFHFDETKPLNNGSVADVKPDNICSRKGLIRVNLIPQLYNWHPIVVKVFKGFMGKNPHQIHPVSLGAAVAAEAVHPPPAIRPL